MTALLPIDISHHHRWYPDLSNNVPEPVSHFHTDQVTCAETLALTYPVSTPCPPCPWIGSPAPARFGGSQKAALPFLLSCPSSLHSLLQRLKGHLLSFLVTCMWFWKLLCFVHALGRTLLLCQASNTYQNVSSKLMECSSKKNSDYICPYYCYWNNIYEDANISVCSVNVSSPPPSSLFWS